MCVAATLICQVQNYSVIVASKWQQRQSSALCTILQRNPAGCLTKELPKVEGETLESADIIQSQSLLNCGLLAEAHGFLGKYWV